MYGQRQIFTCLSIAVLMALLNFYKSAIQRDKEHRRYADQNRLARQHAAETAALTLRRAQFRSHWLEYADRCWDVHALVLRPMSSRSDAQPVAVEGDATLLVPENGTAVAQQRAESAEKVDPCLIGPSAPAHRSASSGRGKSTSATTPSASPAPTAAVADSTSGGIVYVVVSILLVMLAKAAYDLSKQFREVCGHTHD